MELTEKRQAYIANDLPLIADLLGHHCIFIIAAADGNSTIQLKNIAWRARRIHKELTTLVKQTKNLSEKEHPGAPWLSGYDRSSDK